MSDRTCSIEGCNRQVTARGWCHSHYQQKRKAGAFTARRFYGPDDTCQSGDCTRRPIGSGLCRMHLKRKIKHGSPSLPARTPWEERFWDKVYPCPITGCWLWGASVRKKRGGYGQFTVTHGRNRLAHVLAYELLLGPIPEGLVLDHLCRVTCCVNPDHLEPVTQRVNTLRGMAPGAVLWRNNVCKNGHEFTEENTRRAASGRRRCRTCSLKYRQEYRRRRAA